LKYLKAIRNEAEHSSDEGDMAPLI